jgi:ribosome-binding protein aMBF1 (putative translation factor)
MNKIDRKNIQKIFRNLSFKEGSQKSLGKKLNITESAISKLIHGEFLPGARLCILLESEYGIKKEEIRPDIFTF